MLTHNDIATILAKAAAYDHRKPSHTQILAWHEALNPNLTLQDALNLTALHYAHSTERLMPAHINTLYKQLIRQRLEAPGKQSQLPPPEIAEEIVNDPQKWLTWKRQQTHQTKTTPTTKEIHGTHQ